MKRLFTSGIFAMLGLIGFAGGYFLKFLMEKNLAVSLTLVVVAAVWVKMLDFRDQIFP
ncbi:MAG TPA: hypothetical protein VMW38_27880 [Terriglobia bacterium]|nr:hypothetical protein [Terriglobia bacterium]